MIKRLRKVGNESALILEKPTLEVLGLEGGGRVQLTISDGRLIISPVHPSRVAETEIAEKLDYLLGKRKDVLRKLAE